MSDIIDKMWQLILKPIFFSLEPELAHIWAMRFFSFGLRIPGIRNLVKWRCCHDDPRLNIERFGIDFPSPVGLSGGFDKNAEWFDALSTLGFGFIEVGSITSLPQSGNPKPRLFRLPKDNAILNRMGFNNQGASAIAKKLSKKQILCVLGINIGRSTVISNEHAIADYINSFEALYRYCSYITINVSSPNTPNLSQLQHSRPLRELLLALRECNTRMSKKESCSVKPILLKISPDLDDGRLEEILALSMELGVSGIIATNTTATRPRLRSATDRIPMFERGGLSGTPLTKISRKMVAKLYCKSAGKIPIVGVGGIMCGQDAWEMIRAGASLVQVYSGFVYSGPRLPCSINQYIVDRLIERGSATIEDVIGEAAQEHAGLTTS